MSLRNSGFSRRSAGVVAAGSSADAAVGCRVDYAVTNLGDALSGWALEWTFTAGQRVTQLRGGEFSQSGGVVTVRNAGYNGALGTGASVAPGFNGSWSGGNPAPGAFKLDAVVCTGSVGGTSSTSTTTWKRVHAHGKSMLLGHSDGNESQDKGHLRVTYHHNHFDGSGAPQSAGSVAGLPYSYALEDAQGVKSTVVGGAGAGKISV